MKFGVLTGDQINQTWHICCPLLEKVLKKSGEGNFEIEDVKKFIDRGVFQLWAWIEEDKILACAVTEIITYPRRKICSVMMVGGSGLHIWKKEAVDMVADWGRKNGCTDIEGYVRRGWLKILKDWRVAWITIRRSL